jgi:hypothetical protein
MFCEEATKQGDDSRKKTENLAALLLPKSHSWMLKCLGSLFGDRPDRRSAIRVHETAAEKMIAKRKEAEPGLPRRRPDGCADVSIRMHLKNVACSSSSRCVRKR